MSSRIHLLPESISGRIAAGEVVKNPASVVKELVENAIDAGSDAVTVEIVRGGIERIRVTDNGSGIHPDDMLIAVEKHATSKISTFDDISSITTLGYRGEALASIIAVSQTEIKSQMQGADEGRIFSCGIGGSHVVKPAGLPYGTTVIVDNLFYNIPARRKFLKSAAHETANVTDLMSRLIMSCPKISFKYISNGKTVFHSSGSGQLKDAVSAVYGVDISSALIYVDHVKDNISVSGYVSGVNTQYKTSKNISIFINGRYILSKKLSDSINTAYTERLLKGHFPLAVLHITIPPQSLDVNIHPSKMSVLCDRDAELEMCVSEAVRNALDIKSIPVMKIQGTEKTQMPDEDKIVLPKAQGSISPFYNNKNGTSMRLSDAISVFDIAEEIEAEKKKDANDTDICNITQTSDVFSHIVAQNSASAERDKAVRCVIAEDFMDYTVIGTAFNTYVIIQANDKLYYIDQHAVHERLNYEKLKEQNVIASQQLLLPFAEKLNAHDHHLLVSNSSFLETLGFEIDDFGGTSVKVSAVPHTVAHGDIRMLIEDIIEILNNNTDDVLLLRDKIIRRACRTSIKAGDALSKAELDTLVKELVSSDVIPACPHGRPVAVVLTKDELEKAFKRKV